MADYIQSKVELIHTVKNVSPTKPNKPTDIGSKSSEDEGIGDITPKVKGSGLMKRGRHAVGRFAMIRRAYGILDSAVTAEVNRNLQHDLNRARLSGNSRKATTLQNRMTQFAGKMSSVRGLGMSSVTSLATGNLFILGMQMITELTSRMNTLFQFNEQMRVINEIKEREITFTRHRQERLVNIIYRR